MEVSNATDLVAAIPLKYKNNDYCIVFDEKYGVCNICVINRFNTDVESLGITIKNPTFSPNENRKVANMIVNEANKVLYGPHHTQGMIEVYRLNQSVHLVHIDEETFAQTEVYIPSFQYELACKISSMVGFDQKHIIPDKEGKVLMLFAKNPNPNISKVDRDKGVGTYRITIEPVIPESTPEN